MNRRRNLITIPVLALLLLLSACNLSNEPETIVVTATPSFQALTPSDSTPTVSYVTPTPVMVPTPTLPPNVAVADAQLALRNGDYVKAVQYFEGVLDAPDAAPDLRVAAAYGLGEAALREGLFEQAAPALSEFIKNYPNDSRIPQAHFLRGEAYLGLSEWQSAINDFQKYLELRPGVIDSYAYENIGDAYLALDQPEQSLDAYVKAADATRELASLFALRERLAVSYLNAGQTQTAIQQYDAILVDAKNGPYRASIQLQAAQILLNTGNTSGAHTRLQTIVAEYPSTAAAYEALGILLEAGLTIDSYQQGLIYYSNEDYQAAIQAFNTYTSETGTAPPDVLMMLGRAYRSVGNSQAANTTFQTIIDTYPTDPAYGEAWLEQGRTLLINEDYTGAIQKYSELATQHPDVVQGAEALWRAGYIYATYLDDTANALATFDILGQMFPGSEWAQDGLYMGATLAYNSGNFGSATQLFSQLAATGTGENQAAAYLWVGRLYQQDGKEDLARQAFQAAAAADPGGYYSLRADDLLNGRAPFEPPPKVVFEFDDAAQLSEAEAWLRSTFSITQEGPLYPLGEAIATDPRTIRGQELIKVARYEAAETELESLLTDYESDALATYQLAILYRDLGLYRLSINAAARVITAAGVDTTAAPKYIARLRYPTYYHDLVLPSAEEYDLDPLLVFSLIRQESLFEGFATSYAAAQGLMQIIPDTGEEIAGQLNWPNYQNSDVYRPYINVQFGTFYLRWVLDLVDNLPYAALAGYNGGPGNAMQWLDISGPDLDLFVQTIGYEETRNYVRRIYEQYGVYRAIYGTS